MIRYILGVHGGKVYPVVSVVPTGYLDKIYPWCSWWKGVSSGISCSYWLTFKR